MEEYNTARPHQSCGGRPPIEPVRLADRSLTADDSAAPEQAPAAATAVPAKRLAGGVPVGERPRQVSLAGFSYAVGATFAGEPVEVVVSGGLVDARHLAGRHDTTEATRRASRTTAAGSRWQGTGQLPGRWTAPGAMPDSSPGTQR
jgi:hypothetical protein